MLIHEGEARVSRYSHLPQHVLREADCKHQALDGNSKNLYFTQTFMVQSFKQKKVGEKIVDSVERFSIYPSIN